MEGVLSNLSDDLAATVSQAGTWVVRVESRRRLPASGVIWSADGVIATAHHVLEQEDNIRVGLPDGQTVPASVVGRDPTTDIAVLRTESKGLTPPTWDGLDGLRVGHLVLALGRPGETVRATLGIVSTLGDSWFTPAGGRVDRYLHTDVVMYPGFSGGPLVDAAGQVLGLNTSAILRGITITVPSPTVRRTVETLLAHGRIRRGYLGVGTQPARLPPTLAQQFGQETGLLLVAVAPGSPAEQGGLYLGDTIIALDGHQVRYIDDLLGVLGGAQVGATASIQILRGGQMRELTVTLGERT